MTEGGQPDEPLVSIGIPTYNRVDDLRRAVASVLAQDHRNLEIVLSDNASTDGTEAFCRDAAASDARIRYTRQPVNVGGVANFEFVLRNATGPLFMYFADDDVIAPDYVSSCVRLLRDPKTVVAFAPARLTLDGKPLREARGVDLVSDDPGERILESYRRSSFYSEFYGLSRRELIVSSPRVPQVMHGDWIYVVALVWQGKFRIAPDTWIEKDIGGLSARPKAWAKSMGLSRFHGRFPGLVFPLSAMADIAWKSPVYANASWLRRWGLGFRAALVVFHRLHLSDPGGRWQRFVERRRARV